MFLYYFPVQYFNTDCDAEVNMKSIKTKLMISFLLIICFVITLYTMFYYSQSSSSIKTKVGTESYNSLVQLDSNMSNSFNEIESIAKPFFVNQDLQKLLLGKKTDIESIIALRTNLSQTIDTNYYLDDMTVLDGDMEYFLGVKPIVNTPLLYQNMKEKFIESNRDSNLWLGPFYVMTTNEPRKYYIQCKPIRRISNYSDIIGYLCISIDESKIKDSYLNIITNSKASLGIINSNGIVFSNSDNNLVGNTSDSLEQIYGMDILADNYNYKIYGNKLVSVYSSTLTGYIFYRIDELDDFNLKIRTLIIDIVAITLISIAVAFFIAMAFISKILNPLRKLEQNMMLVEKGNFENKVEITNDDEIGNLAKVYNNMIQKIKLLVEDIRVLERKKRESELYVLQTQINPHFIYNTLSTIKWLAVKFGEIELSDLVSDFGMVLRSSISIGKQYVTLSEEIKCLKSYGAIQRVRFDKKFEILFEVDESIMNCVVLKFMLQILLENAIVHGIEPKKEIGLIRVVCKPQGNELFFCVEDNGIGITPEVLSDLRNKLKSQHFEGFMKSIGLLNLKERLRIYYGEEYKIYIESTANVCTKVFFYTPIQWEVPTNENDNS